MIYSGQSCAKGRSSELHDRTVVQLLKHKSWLESWRWVVSYEDFSTNRNAFQSTWKTPGFREYHRRMQLFVLLYIEGGSYISEDEETWEFAVLYEKRRRRSSPDVFTYHFVGYSTLYPFYCFPERVRLRVSQFLILPPYQQDGHGSALYTAIYQHVLAQPRIAELTVEDPAEAFEDLRDRNDLKMLLANEKFMGEGFGPQAVSSNGGKVGGVGNGRKARGKGRTMRAGAGKMGPPAERTWLEKWRTDLKIAGVRVLTCYLLAEVC